MATQFAEGSEVDAVAGCGPSAVEEQRVFAGGPPKRCVEARHVVLLVAGAARQFVPGAEGPRDGADGFPIRGWSCWNCERWEFNVAIGNGAPRRGERADS